jgi:hypothetical protein
MTKEQKKAIEDAIDFIETVKDWDVQGYTLEESWGEILPRQPSAVCQVPVHTILDNLKKALS